MNTRTKELGSNYQDWGPYWSQLGIQTTPSITETNTGNECTNTLRLYLTPSDLVWFATQDTEGTGIVQFNTGWHEWMRLKGILDNHGAYEMTITNCAAIIAEFGGIPQEVFAAALASLDSIPVNSGPPTQAGWQATQLPNQQAPTNGQEFTQQQQPATEVNCNDYTNNQETNNTLGGASGQQEGVLNIDLQAHPELSIETQVDPLSGKLSFRCFIKNEYITTIDDHSVTTYIDNSTDNSNNSMTFNRYFEETDSPSQNQQPQYGQENSGTASPEEVVDIITQNPLISLLILLILVGLLRQGRRKR